MSKVVFEVQGDPSPLAFTCPSPVTLDNLHKHFPLPGKWHFRAKQAAPGVAEFVWMDLVEPGKVPSFQGIYYIKAFPIESDPGPYLESNDTIKITYDEDDDDPSVIPIRGSETSRRNVTSQNNERHVESRHDPIKEATSGLSSIFGKALASSAKAMEQMRKKFDEI